VCLKQSSDEERCLLNLEVELRWRYPGMLLQCARKERVVLRLMSPQFALILDQILEEALV
jgi:hypothetical protein